LKIERVELIHGGGGEAMLDLIESYIIKVLGEGRLPGGVGVRDLDDGATIPLGEWEVVVTSDGYTVHPIFFPGGDIGRLAVAGAINDLSVMGARPLAVLDNLIVEEGFPVADLEKIVKSMSSTAKEAGAVIIGGDLKVMPKGRVDKIVISTTGIGIAKRGQVITDSGLKSGDKIIVTGTIGEHEMALISVREGIEFESEIKSDVAPIWPLIEKALEIGGLTAAKDPTRGGLAAALNEMARKSSVGIIVYESEIPIRDSVRAASEMLGLDPLYLACEGRAVMGVKSEVADEVLEAIRSHPLGRNAAVIGEVTNDNKGLVVLETIVGGKRLLEPPIGTPLPRVC